MALAEPTSRQQTIFGALALLALNLLIVCLLINEAPSSGGDENSSVGPAPKQMVRRLGHSSMTATVRHRPRLDGS